VNQLSHGNGLFEVVTNYSRAYTT